jgi:hypothetical protein
VIEPLATEEDRAAIAVVVEEVDPGPSKTTVVR